MCKRQNSWIIIIIGVVIIIYSSSALLTEYIFRRTADTQTSKQKYRKKWTLNDLCKQILQCEHDLLLHLYCSISIWACTEYWVHIVSSSSYLHTKMLVYMILWSFHEVSLIFATQITPLSSAATVAICLPWWSQSAIQFLSIWKIFHNHFFRFDYFLLVSRHREFSISAKVQTFKQVIQQENNDKKNLFLILRSLLK